jgi:Flp pilus assembly protein TadB
LITTIFFSVLIGVGLFIIVTSAAWGGAVENKSDASRIFNQYKQEDENPPDEGFFQNTRKRGIGKAIDQAGLEVSEGAFIRTGLIIATLTAAVAYFISGGLVVTLFLSIVSFLIYVRWLYDKRDKKRLEYEEAVASVAERMSTAARIDANIVPVIMQAANMAPPAISDDMSYLANEISGGAPIFETFAKIQNKRHSAALDLLVETLNIWTLKGTTIPLSEVVEPIVTTVRQLAATRRQVESDMTMQRMQMFIVAAAPFYFVVSQRMSSIENARFFSTFIGELIQIGSYSCSLVGLFLGEKTLEGVRKLLEV